MQGIDDVLETVATRPPCGMASYTVFLVNRVPEHDVSRVAESLAAVTRTIHGEVRLGRAYALSRSFHLRACPETAALVESDVRVKSVVRCHPDLFVPAVARRRAA